MPRNGSPCAGESQRPPSLPMSHAPFHSLRGRQPRPPGMNSRLVQTQPMRRGNDADHQNDADHKTEREGFEPSVQLPAHAISSRVPSAARTPLQSRREYPIDGAGNVKRRKVEGVRRGLPDFPGTLDRPPRPRLCGGEGWGEGVCDVERQMDAQGSPSPSP